MLREYTAEAPVPIGPARGSTATATVSPEGLHRCLRDVAITVDIEHEHLGDLRITLTSPEGLEIVLVSRPGLKAGRLTATFNDAAPGPLTEAIPGADGQVSGRFRPLQSLGALDNANPNGPWILTIHDEADGDEGVLRRFTLTLDDGVFRYDQAEPVAIPAPRGSTITSPVVVSGLGGAVVARMTVDVDITHSWIGDLSLLLRAPDGTAVTLFARRGRGGDDLKVTFDDRAPESVADARPPFPSPLRPEEALTTLKNHLADGTWTLEVTDHADRDGGRLNAWGIELRTHCASAPATSEFDIEVRFGGGLSPSQRSVFALAAARWSEVIIGDLPEVRVGSDTIDDVLILASGAPIDTVGQILGQAGPTHLRSGSQLPARGEMMFDTHDLDAMEADGSLIATILHEMGHVLGLGTVWKDLGLVRGSGTDDPVFIGPRAMAEYAAILGRPDPVPVPLANTGGPGTREGHWREADLGSELMTGFANPGAEPLSRLTIAALEDMGYEVRYEAADVFTLGALMSFVGAGPHPAVRCGIARRPEAVTLDPEGDAG